MMRAIMNEQDKISEREFTRVVQSIDEKVTKLDANFSKVLKYTMKNDIRIEAVEGKVKGYEKMVLRAAAAVVLSFGSVGAGIYSLTPDPPPTENHTPKTELKTVSTNDSN